MKGAAAAEATATAHSFGVDLARNFGGALLFSFPLLMTMEMWRLGFYMDRLRLALFLLFVFVLVAGLSYFEGGEESLKIEALDAFVACAVGYALALLLSLYVLWAFGRLDGMESAEAVTATVVLGFPAALGAASSRLIL